MHVEEEMAVECPVARVVRRQVEGDLASRKHVHGVLHRVMARMTVHHLEEMAVEVDRVLHHRVVDQRYPHALVASEADRLDDLAEPATVRSEEHTSELQSLMRISYAFFCLNKKKQKKP